MTLFVAHINSGRIDLRFQIGIKLEDVGALVSNRCGVVHIFWRFW